MSSDSPNRDLQTVLGPRITLAHGGGGQAMRGLVETLLASAFANPLLAPLEDQAILPLTDLHPHGDRLAFTTDSFVVNPLCFPGGDIGALAVNGTVNDLAVGGARPLYLSCGLVIEEGLPMETLAQIIGSMKSAAERATVKIVTGDTKVVEKGAADKLFINTAGIGVIRQGVTLSSTHARPGDAIVVNGSLGDHGTAILLARNDLALDADVASDTQPLSDLVSIMLDVCPDIRCLRDPTRGGLAAVLNEFAAASKVAIQLDEASLPFKEAVRGACEILGLDPLYLANEGKLVAVVPSEQAPGLVEAMRAHPMGQHSAIIGTVKAGPPGMVTLATTFGGTRIVDVPVGDPLPRIC